MFEKYRIDIAIALKTFLKAKASAHKKVNKHAFLAVQRLGRSIAEGKLVRGSLVLWSYEAFSKARSKAGYKRALDTACVLELFHNSLLIHDDVMDGDQIRRGQPSMFAQYALEGQKFKARNPLKYGESMAICVGDLGYFWAIGLVPEDLQGLVSAELANVAIAQMHDVYCGEVEYQPTKKEILNTYLYKTARYTFSLPLVAGAKLAGAKPYDLKSLEKIGEGLGIAFQIKDDELGLLGSEEEIGKPVGSDMVSDKKTLHRLMLLDRVPKKDLVKLKRLYGIATLKQSDIEWVRTLLKEYKVISDLEKVSMGYLAEAGKEFSKLRLKKSAASEMMSLIDYLAVRKK